MIITLAHASKFKDYKMPWLYFGNSYSKMIHWKKRLSGNWINLQTENHKQAEIQKKPFLVWIESQRIANNDSIYWWMTQIAGRNNAYSNFFLNLCQLFAILNYLKKNAQEEKILIICEDSFLLELLKQNLPVEAQLKFSFFIKYYWLKDISHLFTKGLLSQLKLIYIFLSHYAYARITRPKKINKPKGDINLFHHCLDKTESFQNNIITCKYFTVLPDWLQKQGEKVFGLPWLFNNRPSKNFYENLRKTNCLIPEDWLNLKDYIYAFRSSVKSLKTLRYDISYPKVKISYLVFKERLSQISEQSAFFWRYIPAIKKWGEELNSIVTYDRYENGITEHPIRYIVKKLPIKSLTIGYYHSLVSKEFMIYQYIESEWESKMKPDFIACSGKIGKNQLINQGVPIKKLLCAAALRQSVSSYDKTFEKNISKQLLILLPMDIEESIEILMKIFSNNDLITNELELKIKIKNHPMLKPEIILKKIKWNQLPTGWEWTTKDLYSELNDSYCCITMDTASAFDAILAGNIVIPFMSDLKIMDNYLDFFSNKYSLVCSVSEKDFTSKLKDIFISKILVYKKEFSKIRAELLEGINSTNPENLNAFILKNE